MITTLLLLLGSLAAALLDGSLLELQRGGAWWRVLTCHFTHFTYEQLAWDAIMFLALGAACERRNRGAFHATLLASAITIPLAVLAFAPHVQSYRGLSGIDSALFALLLVLEVRRSKTIVLLAAGFTAKLVFELATGTTVFVSDMGPGVVPLPLAHAVGALTALIIATLRTKAVFLAPLALASCITLDDPIRVSPAACARGTLAGTWRSARMTQFGPATVTVTFTRDCRFRVRMRFIVGEVVTTGSYAEELGRLRVITSTNQKLWPIEFDGRTLVIEEDGERHVYTRVPCASSSMWGRASARPGAG